MGCLSGIATYLLYLFNFLIVLCGIALIAVGAINLVNEDKGIDGFTDFSVGGFAIAVGVIIFIIAFFGCCGAIRKNSCMLTTYAIILIILLILQVVLGALAFVSIKDDDDLRKTVRDAVEDVFKHYGENSDKTKVVDDVQQYFKCCGVDNAKYWGANIPASCFEDKNRSSTQYTEGCTDSFKDFITSNIKIIGGIAVGFAVVELVGAIFAFMIRNK